MVGGPSRRSKSGLETIPKVRKWSGDPPGGMELIGVPFRRSGSGRGILLEVWNWSLDPL